MLSLFPQILFLSPLGTALVRVVAGIVVLSLAWNHYKNRGELSTMRFIVIGGGMWVPILAAIVEAATGAALVVGLYTQAAAIIGAILALKSLVWKRRYSAFFPLSYTAAFLLLAVCISLIVSGAGIFAFDLPL